MNLVVVQEALGQAVADRDAFGILLQRDGGPTDWHEIGTEARITGRHHHPDGGLSLRVTGRRRFRIDTVLERDPVPMAAVGYLADEPGSGYFESMLDDVEAAVRRYMAVSAESGEGGNINVRISRDPVVASYQVASLLRVSPPERQELLEAGTAADRLGREAAMLGREAALLRYVLGMGRMTG